MDAPPPADVVFAATVEDTVCLWSRSLAGLTDREVRLIRALGCDHYDCRAVAEDVVVGMGQGALRLLTWGSRHRDPQTRDACRRLVQRLYWCRECGGSGECPDTGKPGHDQWRCKKEVPFTGHCKACDGWGDVRYELWWVDREGEGWRERDLFGGLR